MAGNITHDEALEVSKMVEDTLKLEKPVLYGQLVERRIVQLEPGASCRMLAPFKHSHFCYFIGKTYIHRMKALNPEDINSAIVNYYQVGPATDLRQSAILALFVQLTNGETFGQLRTQEQLGYIVTSYAQPDLGINVRLSSERPYLNWFTYSS